MIDSAETLLSVDRTAYSIAFHPSFERNGYLYLGSNGPLSAERPGGKMQIARFTMARRAPFGLDPASEEVIIDWASDGHNGGGIASATTACSTSPTGDGTSDSDDDNVGQDMTGCWPSCCASTSTIPSRGKPTRCRRTTRLSA